MKIVVRLLLALVLAILIAAVAGWFFMNRIAEKAVERGGTYALGAQTEVGSASVGLFAGEFALSDVAVRNPEGFEAPRFLHLDSCMLAVTMASLREDVVEAPLLELNGVQVAIERRGGKTNYGTILESLERFESDEKVPAEEGKRFLIREVVVRDVTAEVDLLPAGGSLTKTTLRIPEIRLENVGSAEEGASVGQIAAQLVKALLQAVVEGGAGQIPAEILQDLQGSLGRLSDIAVDVTGQVQSQVEEIGKELEKEAGKAVEDVRKGLEGVLGGKKKD